MKKYISLITILSLSACSNVDVSKTVTPSDFLTELSPLCGQTYLGKVVSEDPQDEEWRQAVLTLGPIDCETPSIIKMPLAVGDDRSRTWFLSPTKEAIEFRHQHLLKNGDVDPVSDYGGYSENLSLMDGVWSVDFPADEKTIKIFKETGLDVSITNVWTFEYVVGAQLNYELNREGRHFRAEFDLVNPE